MVISKEIILVFENFTVLSICGKISDLVSYRLETMPWAVVCFPTLFTIHWVSQVFVNRDLISIRRKISFLIKFANERSLWSTVIVHFPAPIFWKFHNVVDIGAILTSFDLWLMVTPIGPAHMHTVIPRKVPFKMYLDGQCWIKSNKWSKKQAEIYIFTFGSSFFYTDSKPNWFWQVVDSKVKTFIKLRIHKKFFFVVPNWGDGSFSRFWPGIFGS